MYSKGAPEVLLHKCSHIHTSQGIEPLSELGKKHLLQINELLGHKGMRTIACAYKSIPHDHTTSSEHELVFLGLAAMEDAPHEQAAQAVLACQTAGISVKMITGDQAPTALSIAPVSYTHLDVYKRQPVLRQAQDDLAGSRNDDASVEEFDLKRDCQNSFQMTFLIDI